MMPVERLLEREPDIKRLTDKPLRTYDANRCSREEYEAYRLMMNTRPRRPGRPEIPDVV